MVWTNWAGIAPLRARQSSFDSFGLDIKKGMGAAPGGSGQTRVVVVGQNQEVKSILLKLHYRLL